MRVEEKGFLQNLVGEALSQYMGAYSVGGVPRKRKISYNVTVACMQLENDLVIFHCCFISETDINGSF